MGTELALLDQALRQEALQEAERGRGWRSWAVRPSTVPAAISARASTGQRGQIQKAIAPVDMPEVRGTGSLSDRYTNTNSALRASIERATQL